MTKTSPQQAMIEEAAKAHPNARASLEAIFQTATDRLAAMPPDKMPVFLAKLVLLLAKNRDPEEFSKLCDIAQREL